MKNLIIVFVAIVLSNCTPRITPSTDRQKIDSVRVSERIVIRDTTVYVPVDSACIRAEVICPTDGTQTNLAKIIQHGRRSSVSVEIKNGHLEVKSNCDSLAYQLKLMEIERDSFAMSSESEKKTVVVQVKFIPKVVKVFAWIGGIVCAGGVFYLIFKFGFKLI